MYEFADTVPSSASSADRTLKIIFNEIDLEKELSDEDGSFITLSVSGRSNIKQNIQTLNVNGVDGLYEFHNPTIEYREITVKYLINDKTSEDLNKRLMRLNSLLIGSKKTLQFTDESVVYYATLLSNDIPEEVSNSYVATITFLCSDPFKYGETIFTEMTGDTTIIDIQGTEQVYPVFELEVLAPITFAMISNGNEFMLIGQPSDVTEKTVNKKEMIFHHDMESLTGWVESNVVNEGYVKGSFGVTNYGFYPILPDPDPGVYEWYGPVMKHGLQESVQDFLADMGFRFFTKSRGGSVGRIEMYGLDDRNNVIFRAWIEDKWYGYDHFGFCLELANGERTEYVTLPKGIEDIYGRLKVKREGNNWTIIMQQLQDGSGKVVVREWTKTIETDQVVQSISQIQLAFQKFYDTNEEDMEVLLMRCFKLNDIEGVPYIAQEGDVITLDHREKQNYGPEIRINGELRNDLKDFGAIPFSLKPGENNLVLLPSGQVQGSVQYMPTYR
ncbi:distal tail protein Dit [Paraliobacillus ryukyuensis]|uniref:distal tail protein Dit n=1 Tax=Paraliobacillus ryukyuensis TaxID=200904 RepID=UPI0009A8F360|nr:distal tail protein Dit [Paraliobacillus ryukyuensis]